jgi:hypothetical protein
VSILSKPLSLGLPFTEKPVSQDLADAVATAKPKMQ